ARTRQEDANRGRANQKITAPTAAGSAVRRILRPAPGGGRKVFGPTTAPRPGWVPWAASIPGGEIWLVISASRAPASCRGNSRKPQESSPLPITARCAGPGAAALTADSRRLYLPKHRQWKTSNEFLEYVVMWGTSDGARAFRRAVARAHPRYRDQRRRRHNN